jgi:hypothetical protein
MQLMFLGRKVEVLNIQFGSDPVDTYIEKAEFIDDETMLSDNELNTLEKLHADSLYSAWFEHQQCKAEYLAEGTER